MSAAERLKLGGYVRNLPDGSVEVVSQGPDTVLETMEHELRRGPSSARVETVERLQVPLEPEIPESFEIR